MGADLRWERLNVDAAAVADRLVHLQQPVHRSARARRTPARRSPASCSGRCSSSRSTCSRTRFATARTSRSTSSRTTGASRDRLTVNAGLRYTLNFPSTEENNQAAVFNLETQQLEYLGRDGQPRAARAAAQAQFRPAPRHRRPGDRQDGGARPATALVWIEMAGITTPFTTPVFPFLQTVSQRTLDNITPAFVLAAGRSVAADSADAGRRPRPGRVLRRSRSRIGLRAAVERLGPARAHVEHRRSRSAYVGSKITRVGIPDTNLNQLTVDQLAQGAPLLQRVPNPFFGTIPRSSSLGDPTIPRGAAAEAVSRSTRPSASIATTSARRSTTASTPSSNSASRSGLSYLVSYTRSKLMDDASSVFDASILTGPVANFPVADSFNRRSSATTRPATFRTCSSRRPCGICRSGANGAIQPRRARRDRQRLDADRHPDAAVGHARSPIAQATNNNAFAGFGTQRPNLIGDPTLPADERSVEPLVQHERLRGRAAVHARHELAQSGARARATATSIWR